MDEIINKVANSSLQVFDLEDYWPVGIRSQIDISQWLVEGFLLKETEYRQALKQHDCTNIKTIMWQYIVEQMLLFLLGPAYWRLLIWCLMPRK